ncbi:hypothetical protein BCR44DRAFT_1391528, partial [Catenaria anguillulae PL171]
PRPGHGTRCDPLPQPKPIVSSLRPSVFLRSYPPPPPANRQQATKDSPHPNPTRNTQHATRCPLSQTPKSPRPQRSP